MDAENSCISFRQSSESPEPEPRLQARGRGRGRGRGQRSRRPRARGGQTGRRGVGRRQQGQNETTRAERLRTAVAERNEQLQQRIAQLPEDSLRSLMTTVCQRHPSFVFDILDESSRTASSGSHPSPSRNQPDWCVCTFCREMPTDLEKLCCGKSPENCSSRVADFDIIVLDELVLAVAQMYRQDIFALQGDENLNRGNRHAAYRQFILWHHGRLGAGNRRVVPSCCVWRIREKFPDTFGQYKGFTDGRLG